MRNSLTIFEQQFFNVLVSFEFGETFLFGDLVSKLFSIGSIILQDFQKYESSSTTLIGCCFENAFAQT